MWHLPPPWADARSPWQSNRWWAPGWHRFSSVWASSRDGRDCFGQVENLGGGHISRLPDRDRHTQQIRVDATKHLGLVGPGIPRNQALVHGGTPERLGVGEDGPNGLGQALGITGRERHPHTVLSQECAEASQIAADNRHAGVHVLEQLVR